MKYVVIEVYKIIHNLSPEYMSDLFQSKECYYIYRNKFILKLPTYKTNKFGKQCFRFEGAKLWNSLPNNIKCITDVKMFKDCLHKCKGFNCECKTCIGCAMSNV